MTNPEPSKKFTIEKVGGIFHKVTPIFDNTGKLIHNIVTPLQIDFQFKDVFQIIIGAYILAVPVAFTEEVWVLSSDLPLENVLGICGISVFFISCFVYHNFYKQALRGHVFDFIKRIVVTYGLSLAAVGLFLTLITKCPWGIDNILAIKRIILVTFPASMAATISDTIK